MLGFLTTLVVLYLGLVLLLVVFEKSFIFFPQFPGRLSGDWHPEGLPVEDVWLRAADAVKLHAWWISAPGAEFTFVAFHGNAANIANREDIYRFLRTVPVNVLAVEYRGYGKSEGSPSEAGLYLDAEAAYDHLTKQRGIAPTRVIAFGASLGAAVAADLAARREVGGVVLEAPFPSTAAVARRVYWFLPGLGLLARTKLDIGSKLEHIRASLLVVHCTQDPVIAIDLGEEVFQRAHEPKRFVRLEGVGHEQGPLVAPEQYRRELTAFLEGIRSKKQ